jgi:hypothetical protein
VITVNLHLKLVLWIASGQLWEIIEELVASVLLVEKNGLVTISARVLHNFMCFKKYWNYFYLNLKMNEVLPTAQYPSCICWPLI